MNERIKELAEQAGMVIIEDRFSTYLPFVEKFAELIVEECKPQWQGLTGEELRNIAREFKGNTQRRFEDHWDEIVAFVREAEAKLKEKNT